MGTNYYVKERECKHCGRHERRHIGKSSGGWCFSLRVYPDDRINTLEDWMPILRDGSIVDEYGSDISTGEMLKTISDRFWKGNDAKNLDKEYLRRNSAEPGPNNLLRHLNDGVHCVGHGEGTWDYIVGEFI